MEEILVKAIKNIFKWWRALLIFWNKIALMIRRWSGIRCLRYFASLLWEKAIIKVKPSSIKEVRSSLQRFKNLWHKRAKNLLERKGKDRLFKKNSQCLEHKIVKSFNSVSTNRFKGKRSVQTIYTRVMIFFDGRNLKTSTRQFATS